MRLVHSILCGASALFIATGAFAQASGSGASPSSGSGAAPSAGSGASPSGGASGSASKRGMQLQQGQSRQQLFQSLDTNNDGQISKAEAAASPALVILFPATDTNSDGAITVVEFEAVPLTNADGSAAK